ncbi:hypothetical protein BH24ACT23_BH24ACT23_07030 [soil metagenome]
MRSRKRAAAFALGALVCAGVSAALADSAAGPAGAGLGDLQPVLATTQPLERGTVIGRKDAAGAFAVRRVPGEFAPPDALVDPAEAFGRRLAVELPAGSYVSGSDFSAGRARSASAPGAPTGTTPVEIEVRGASALTATRTGIGERVDVVVSGVSAPGPQSGRTYVAARGAILLALREAEAETGLAADRWIATLALDRHEALRLIRAEGVAASIRLLAG